MASPPTAIRSWQFSTTIGGLENNLTLASTPLPTPKPNEHLVRVVASAINPVDYKIVEVGFVRRFILPKNSTPGIDFAGYIVAPAQGSDLKPGTPVFGHSGGTPMVGGALREYTTAKPECIARAPEGVSMVDLAGVATAGGTSWQAIQPYVKSGSRVFINGGSGGCGIFAIQFAKALGAYVTVSCSGANVELCKSLGADEVIDYRTQDVVEALKASSANGKYDHIVDNAGFDWTLHLRAHEYATPAATYLYVGGAPSLRSLQFLFKGYFLPAFLGGAKTKFRLFGTNAKQQEFAEIAQLMKEGKVRTVIDSRFKFEDVKDAYKKLKTGRAKGKIIIDVAEEKE